MFELLRALKELKIIYDEDGRNLVMASGYDIITNTSSSQRKELIDDLNESIQPVLDRYIKEEKEKIKTFVDKELEEEKQNIKTFVDKILEE